MYKSLLKPLLFKKDPEAAHYYTVNLLRRTLGLPFGKSIVRAIYHFEDDSLERTVAGLKFANPVGLAAGFDKDGKFYKEMTSLGFGFIEIGTVTPLPQAGNEKPRLFRLPEDEALINRMGFNNDGVEAMVHRLELRGKPEGVILGGNIGKNKVTPNEEAVNDYLICFDKLHDYVDYFVVNVSSPNTPGLRELQEKGPLLKILSALKAANDKKTIQRPIFLKIAPDLNNAQLDDIIDIVQTSGIAGVIATNTTIDRSGLHTSEQEVQKIGAGGLSGKPVQARSTEVIRYLHDKSAAAFPIIGVGGIDSPQSAQEKLDAGASLIQVYSGMIYQGPSLIKDIKKYLVKVENKA